MGNFLGLKKRKKNPSAPQSKTGPTHVDLDVPEELDSDDEIERAKVAANVAELKRQAWQDARRRPLGLAGSAVHWRRRGGKRRTRRKRRHRRTHKRRHRRHRRTHKRRRRQKRHHKRRTRR